MTTSNEIYGVWSEYATCTKCALHRNRRGSIHGYGNVESKIVFLLDRLDPEDVRGGSILRGDQKGVLSTLLEFIGYRVGNFYYTSLTACPPKPPHVCAYEQMVAMADSKHAGTCSDRVLREIDAIGPYAVIACGAAAARVLRPKKGPKVQTPPGSLMETMVPGAHVSYAVPVMVTHSIHALSKTRPTDQAALWYEVCEHIDTTIALVHEMHRLENQYGKADDRNDNNDRRQQPSLAYGHEHAPTNENSR